MTLPFLQLVIAIALAIRWTPLVTWTAASLLFAGFIVAQISVLWRGLEISCGCFGVSDGVQVGLGTLSVAGSGLIASVVGLALSRISLQNKHPAQEAAR